MSMEWRVDMPKLSSLTNQFQFDNSTFKYPHSITLEGIPYHLPSLTDMPSLTTVTLNKGSAFSEKKTIHTRSSFFSFSPSFLDITAALQEYLQFIVSFTYSLLAITPLFLSFGLVCLHSKWHSFVATHTSNIGKQQPRNDLEVFRRVFSSPEYEHLGTRRR